MPGRPLLYGTTSEFLRCFSVSTLEELPELPNHDAEQSIEAVLEAAESVQPAENQNEAQTE